MTEKNSISSMLKIATLTIGVVVAVSSIAVYPYRINQNEKTIHRNNELLWQAIAEIRSKRELDHEILVRIEERLKRIDPLFLKGSVRSATVN